MIEEVRAFADDLFAAAVFGGNDKLDGLFARLFGDLVHALFKEIGGVTALFGVYLPVLDDAQSCTGV